MHRLRWLLILLCAVPWAFLALGETPKGAAPKKGKPGTKAKGKMPDLMSLSEPERRIALRDMMADDRRKKRDENLKAQRAAALKAAIKLESQLKTAENEDKPAILYELGVAHWRASNVPQALKRFRQLAETPPEQKSESRDPNSEIWCARARIHQFDILLYENHDLRAAR